MLYSKTPNCVHGSTAGTDRFPGSGDDNDAGKGEIVAGARQLSTMGRVWNTMEVVRGRSA